MRRLRPLLSTLFLAALLSFGSAHAQPAAPALDAEVALAALGGATFKAPAWKSVHQDETVAVLERAPDPASKLAFHVLLFAIEDGPKGERVDWTAIRDNIQKAANRDNRELKLVLGDPFTGAEGFEGRKMSGEYTAGDQSVGFEIVTLVRDGRLLTISLVSETPDAGTLALLEAVAATAKLKG